MANAWAQWWTKCEDTVCAYSVRKADDQLDLFERIVNLAFNTVDLAL
jgi:hypothetical protein